MPCLHPRAQVRHYVGSTETYNFCPECWETWGGEETPAKRTLIRGAAMADERWLTPDHDHLKAEGR